jgi:hypothetical protein
LCHLHLQPAHSRSNSSQPIILLWAQASGEGFLVRDTPSATIPPGGFGLFGRLACPPGNSVKLLNPHNQASPAPGKLLGPRGAKDSTIAAVTPPPLAVGWHYQAAAVDAGVAFS